MLPNIPRFRRTGKSGEHEIASLLDDFTIIWSPEYDFGFDFFANCWKTTIPQASSSGFKQKQLRSSTITGVNILRKRL